MADAHHLARLDDGVAAWNAWREREPQLVPDLQGAHSDGYSPWWSCTIRTTRSRTSGENLFDLFMAPSSQELEPPQNPGRFRHRKARDRTAAT